MGTTRKMRIAAVVAAVVTLVASTGTASASGNHRGGGGGSGPVTLAEGLAGPLQIDAAGNGVVLVAQSFGGTLSAVKKGGAVTDLVSRPGEEISGVAAGPFGSVYFTRGTEDGVSEVWVRDFKGKERRVADLSAFEAAKNPDQVNTYGFQGLAAECAAQLPPDLGPASYTGIVESHAYALASTPFGVLVADAAANDIVLVDWWGKVRVVSVLPPQPAVITPDGAAANGLPECTVGSTYSFEPVPTDVEVGPGGSLYVTSLPGGPEDPSLGARGSVLKVNPWNGRTTTVATGFAAATNLAVSPNGTIYVAELFGGQVSKVVRGAPVPVAAVDSPAAVEWDRGRLLVTSEVFGAGKLLSIPI